MPLRGDLIDEINETFSLKLSAPVGARLVRSRSRAKATIVDNDGPPTLSISSSALTEGDAGSSNLVFTAELSRASGKQVSAGFGTSEGSASAPEDYTGQNGTVTFAPGQTSRTVPVAVHGDVVDELDEAFSLTLVNPVDVILGTSTAVGTIVDDDGPAISIDDVTMNEGSGASTATFTVSLSMASSDPVTADFATSDGTATAGSDYTSAQGSLSFAPGETSKSIVVHTLGDADIEASESFVVDLTSVVGATAGDTRGRATLRNDDGPSVSINDIGPFIEWHDGSVERQFTVTLSEVASVPVTVDYRTVDGSAHAGSDYQATSGTLTIPAGQTSKTIAVFVHGDSEVEGSETFTVELDNPGFCMLGDATGQASITDDD